jgi:predicted DNA-binding ribbon-helix-helix protein
VPHDEIRETGPRKRSLCVNGKKTSIAITDELWEELKEIAVRDGLSAAQLVGVIRDADPGNLGRAVRLYIINRRTSPQRGC